MVNKSQPKRKTVHPMHEQGHCCRKKIRGKVSIDEVRRLVVAEKVGMPVMREDFAFGRKGSAQLARSMRSLDLLFKELVSEGYLTRQDPMFPNGYPGDYRHDHHWQPKKWHRR